MTMFKVEELNIDRNLAFVIQSITKEPTANIIEYFHALALHVAEEYHNSKPENRINKVLEWHYKNTVLPYKMEVYTSYNERFDQAVTELYVRVNFPKKRNDIDVTEMLDTVLEVGLGLEGSVSLPPFPAPQTRVSAGFKKFLHK